MSARGPPRGPPNICGGNPLVEVLGILLNQVFARGHVIVRRANEPESTQRHVRRQHLVPIEDAAHDRGDGDAWGRHVP